MMGGYRTPCHPPSPVKLPAACGAQRPLSSPRLRRQARLWRPPWLGTVPCFSLQSGDQFRAKPPPALNSERYTKDYNEVKALGAHSDSARTPEQTELAYFYTGVNGNNFLLWHRTLRDIAAAHVKNMGDSSRLLALANFAIADSVITAWDSKKHYVLWRPVTAIQEGENDENAATAGDPSWQPFLNTPPYPEYTSGA